MKKTLTLAALVLLLAAGCNSNKVVKNNQNQSDQQNQDQQSTSTADNLPQGEKSGWNSYTSPAKYGFSIQYPNDFGFNTDVNKIKSLSYIPTCDENTVGCVFYSGDKYKGTNFEGAGVSVNILSDLNTEAKCYNFNVSTNEAQTPVNDVNINGVTFKSATGGQGAAGHFVKTQVYRNFHNNTCYEVAQRVSNTNINNYPAGTVKEFNQNEIWSNLTQIVSTFKFITTSSKEPTWLTYSDKDISFKYPKTFCGTSWNQSGLEMSTCGSGEWEVVRTVNGYASSKKSSTGAFIHLLPNYSSFGREFGGDIQIKFLSKTDFDSAVQGKNLTTKNTQNGYKVYVEGGVESYPDKANNYYLTNNSKYILVQNNFPDRYPNYLSYLLDSIKLK